jgi:hypothetical protein
MINLIFVAQVATGNELSQQLLEESLELFVSTGESWDRLWELVVNPTQPLWIASVTIAQFIMGFSLLFYAFVIFKNIDNYPTTRQVIDQMPLPLFLGFLITGNGTLLANLVLGLREIFQYFMVLALQIQIAGISVNEALQKIQNTGIVNNRARIIFSECLDKTGTQLTECVSDPVKIAQAEQILNGIGSVFQGNALEAILSAISPGNIAAGATSFLAGAIATVVATPIIAIIQIILLVFQHAFINIVEAALLLTAISAPIFLGLSLFTKDAPLFVLWGTNFISLFFIQLGYIVLIGFNASVVSLMELAGQPVGSTILDLAFLFFMAIFAPGLAVVIAWGGGILLYNQIQNNAVRTIANFI